MATKDDEQIADEGRTPVRVEIPVTKGSTMGRSNTKDIRTSTVPTAATQASCTRDTVDYLHDGHLQPSGEREGRKSTFLDVSATNPDSCTPQQGLRVATTRPTNTAPTAGTPPFHTATTSITSSRDTCIIRTAITAMTTGR